MEIANRVSSQWQGPNC